LRVWAKVVKAAAWKNFAELKQTYAGADQYKQFTIFDIGGNKYRLIAAIHYNTQKLYVRHILTHKEYDAGKWKK
jgi:mRNA interferase HigB